MKRVNSLPAYLSAVALAASGLLGAAPALAQGKFPERPVEIIVNFGPGGSADQAARSVGKLLPAALGVAVPISNVTGASGNAGLTRLRDARPDGHTMGTFTGIAVTTMVQGVSRLKIEDFRFLAIADAGTSMFYVGKGSGVKTFQEVLDKAKKGGTIRVATAGLGTQDDVAVKALTAKGYPMINVPMDPGARHTAPIGGHAELLFQQIDGVVSFVEAGDLVPIVVFANERHPSFPKVPAISEFGMKLNLPNWRGFAVPAATPDDRAKVLTAALGKVLASKEYRDVCSKQYKCLTGLVVGEDARKYAVKYYDDMLATMKELGLAK
ncbi:MAG: tripartite tricarboxylate transporter substrate binding protein [Proteobacteria bacterium]|nr:tripartite tricarboxylate transporter substrate binding protein [Pseudomonadota bacterium]